MVLRLFGNHGHRSALERVAHLYRTVGPIRTAGIFLSVADEQYLHSFDRRYGIRTSGYVELSNTSFERSRLKDATQYKPVSGWGLRKLLRMLNLPRGWQFVDLGSGLGRACILAADYGFAQVTGVELAPELCAVARENVANWQRKSRKKSDIEILQTDALDYARHTDADVVFMFRPFSMELLGSVTSALIDHAKARKRRMTIIYSERMMLPGTYSTMLAKVLNQVSTYGFFGQAFYVYECGPE